MILFLSFNVSDTYLSNYAPAEKTILKYRKLVILYVPHNPKIFFFRCDADPSALSKYVLALIKKDKPESELRESMTNQMEVFLQENTQSFIESLFTTLQSGDYVDGPPKVVARKAEPDDESGKLEDQGKPDSTTSTPANVSELASDLKEAEHKQRSSDVCNI